MNRYIDITGNKYNALTAIQPIVADKSRRMKWKFKCDCGNYIVVEGYKVRKGSVRSCGCNIDGRKVKSKLQRNLIGKRFGSVVVTEMLGHYTDDNCFWSKVKCDCGYEFYVRDTWLVNGTTTRCKYCFYKTLSKSKNHHKRLHQIWQGMKYRCYNPACEKYELYGGRGISICNEWRDNFDSFYEWAITNGYDDSLTIDRIDTDGNYEPSNCRWATYKEQANNLRTTRFINYEGKYLPIRYVSEMTGLNVSTIYARIKNGWSEYDATHYLPYSKRKTR